MRDTGKVDVRQATAVLVAVALCLFIPTAQSGQSDAAGSDAGDNAGWWILGSTLIIGGSGPMYDFTADNRPWGDRTDDIRYISVREGITHIGDYSFYGMTHVEDVVIPSSVKDAGTRSFGGCTSLKNVELSDGFEQIGTEMFAGCTALVQASFPDTLLSIGDRAFSGCTSLNSSGPGTTFTFPDTLSYIGTEAFDGCSGIGGVYLGEGICIIGDNAFRDCTSIDSVVNRSSVPVTARGEDGGMVGHYTDNVTGEVSETTVTDITFRYNIETGAAFVTGIGEMVGVLDMSAITVDTLSIRVMGLASNAIPQDSYGVTTLITGDSLGYLEDGCFRNMYGCDYYFGQALWHLSNRDARCMFITNLEISSSNQHFSTDSGHLNLYSKDGKVLIRASFLDSEEMNYRVKDGVERVSDFAFENCGAVSVSLPSSLKHGFTLNLIWCTFIITDANAKSLSDGRYLLGCERSFDPPDRVKNISNDGVVFKVTISSANEPAEPVHIQIRTDGSAIMEYSYILSISEDGTYRHIDAIYNEESSYMEMYVDGSTYIAFTLQDNEVIENPWMFAAFIALGGTSVAIISQYTKRRKLR